LSGVSTQAKRRDHVANFLDHDTGMTSDELAFFKSPQTATPAAKTLAATITANH
jgi:hypothetical protein